MTRIMIYSTYPSGLRKAGLLWLGQPLLVEEISMDVVGKVSTDNVFWSSKEVHTSLLVDYLQRSLNDGV